MIELSPQNVTAYLKDQGKVSDEVDDSAPDRTLLVQPLSGGVANVVLKIFDPTAGERIGSDTRTPGQIKRGIPDTRMRQGACFVLKQPLPKFKTEAEWLVDIDRALVERDALQLLARVLPAGAVPDVLWFDQANYVLALSCAPTDAVIWKKQLLTGYVSTDAAQQAGQLLGVLHSATAGDGEIARRYGDPKFFIQQRTQPYFEHLLPRHGEVGDALRLVVDALLAPGRCLIHGDFSPKNIFLVPRSPDSPPPPELPRHGVLHPDNPLAQGKAPKPKAFDLAHLLILDLEVAAWGHPGFDVATLVNHLLLKSFHHGGNWQATMIAIDAFWQTYQLVAHDALAQAAGGAGGHMLGALLLARVDGKSPVEYLTDQDVRQRVRTLGRTILADPAAVDLEVALEHAADALSA